MGPACLLDLTRLVSRLGRGPLTGVDRVELAYLRELLGRDLPLFGLVATAAGYLLLDRTGARSLAGLVAGGQLGPSDLLSRLTHWRNPQRASAEATVRRLAIARATRPGLARLIRRVPQGASYLNVGHSNLTDRALVTLHARFRIAVLIHDTIPLDHPAFSRPAAVTSFAHKLRAVATHADLVIHATADARVRTEAQMQRVGRTPDGIVASLGVPMPEPTRLSAETTPTGRYFVVLGTLEPRKNHALLLGVWADLARLGPQPHLIVIGAKGWLDEAVMSRLVTTEHVFWRPGLPDGEVATLLKGANALLFPSFAEGFGLPPVEAAALGIPVIASDLPVTREVMGHYPVYLDPTDSYAWLETITAHASKNAADLAQKPREPPTWAEHFNTVLNIV